jgi:hypothetical protein
MSDDARDKPEPSPIKDEPGMAERFQRGLRRALNTPPKHRAAQRPKPKDRPAAKAGYPKGETRD